MNVTTVKARVVSEVEKQSRALKQNSDVNFMYNCNNTLINKITAVHNYSSYCKY